MIRESALVFETQPEIITRLSLLALFLLGVFTVRLCIWVEHMPGKPTVVGVSYRGVLSEWRNAS